MTKFDELEEVHAELRLKELLWSSLEDWDKLYEDWLAVPFENLDPENMNAQVLSFVVLYIFLQLEI